MRIETITRERVRVHQRRPESLTMDTTRVIFRVDRSGEVTAVLPDVPENSGLMCCYAHIGQHGACDAGWYRSTRPATPAEYASLLSELRGIYETEPDPVRLLVRKRINRLGGKR